MATKAEHRVKLSRPVDFDVLDALNEHGRNVARNLQHHIEASRAHINNRLPYLNDYGLVEKIGPDEDSGLYEITEKGRVALDLRDEYDRSDTDFDELVERELAQRDRD
jgi:predicted transcriptional regulator